MNYREKNAETISRWVEKGWIWGTEIDHETFVRAKNGEWDVVLTPIKSVPKSWFGDLKGKKVLGLSSAGGQQMPILTAAGAHCTVFDICDSMLEKDRLVSKREGISIEIVKGDITESLPFEDESFDLIFYPVSNCYYLGMDHVFSECYRVLKKGGRLLSGLCLETNYIVDESEKYIVQKLPFNPLEDESLMEALDKDDAGVQFSHSIEENIGGQIRAGFILKDIFQDTNGEGYLHSLGIPSFIATLAIK